MNDVNAECLIAERAHIVDVLTEASRSCSSIEAISSELRLSPADLTGHTFGIDSAAGTASGSVGTSSGARRRIAVPPPLQVSSASSSPTGTAPQLNSGSKSRVANGAAGNSASGTLSLATPGGHAGAPVAAAHSRTVMRSPPAPLARTLDSTGGSGGTLTEEDVIMQRDAASCPQLIAGSQAGPTNGRLSVAAPSTSGGLDPLPPARSTRRGTIPAALTACGSTMSPLVGTQAGASSVRMPVSAVHAYAGSDSETRLADLALYYLIRSEGTCHGEAVIATLKWQQ